MLVQRAVPNAYHLFEILAHHPESKEADIVLEILRCLMKCMLPLRKTSA